MPLEMLGWASEHVEAVNDWRTLLIRSTELVHRNHNQALCIYTDTPEIFRSAVVTQCTTESLRFPLDEQRHELLAFLGGEFTGRQTCWTTFEKDAYAVVQTFRKLTHLLACEAHTHGFTDHKNLLFILNPLVIKPVLGCHKVLKVIWWALFLSAFW